MTFAQLLSLLVWNKLKGPTHPNIFSRIFETDRSHWLSRFSSFEKAGGGESIGGVSIVFE
jgi:hypothetical protein